MSRGLYLNARSVRREAFAVLFKDHFSKVAQQYTQFRPRYPRELFQFLASLPSQRDCAWDCGTGNGQAAVDLAEHFARVVATDPSAEQIAHAGPHARVEYRVAPAEECSLGEHSVDLVTVAQALHWFDRDRFYAQTRRVGREGSVLAVWTYGLTQVAPAIDQVVRHLYWDVVGAYWPPERKLTEERYETIDFPFEEVPAPRFSMTAEWNLGEFIGYLGTWSSVQRYREALGCDPLHKVDSELSRAWGASESIRRVTWPVYLRVGRIG